jgi:hypothetical protein
VANGTRSTCYTLQDIYFGPPHDDTVSGTIGQKHVQVILVSLLFRTLVRSPVRGADVVRSSVE